MLTNYIKLALRVLARKKFFTAITLFGISFTLAILMLIVSVMETEVGKTSPLTNKDKMVILPTLQLRKIHFDTIYTIDTSYAAGVMQLDSTYKLEEAGQNNSNNELAWSFLNKYLNNVPSAVNRTFFNGNNSFNAYVNNSKLEMNAVYTDHNFWELFDFQFI